MLGCQPASQGEDQAWCSLGSSTEMRAGSLWESVHDLGTEPGAPQLGRAGQSRGPALLRWCMQTHSSPPMQAMQHCPCKPMRQDPCPQPTGQQRGSAPWTSQRPVNISGYLSVPQPGPLSLPGTETGDVMTAAVPAQPRSPAQRSYAAVATCATQSPAARHQLDPSGGAEVKRPTERSIY